MDQDQSRPLPQLTFHWSDIKVFDSNSHTVWLYLSVDAVMHFLPGKIYRHINLLDGNSESQKFPEEKYPCAPCEMFHFSFGCSVIYLLITFAFGI